MNEAKRYLQMVAALRAENTSLERLILTHGREWNWAPLAEGVRTGIPQACFRNAYMLATRRRDLTYVEGYGCRIIPMYHAWCVTRDGVVIDPTWDALPREDRDPEYFGIPFRLDYVRREMLRRRKIMPDFTWGTIYMNEHIVNDDPAQYLAEWAREEVA